MYIQTPPDVTKNRRVLGPITSVHTPNRIPSNRPHLTNVDCDAVVMIMSSKDQLFQGGLFRKRPLTCDKFTVRSLASEDIDGVVDK